MKKHLFWIIFSTLCLSTTFSLAQSASKDAMPHAMPAESAMMQENMASMGQMLIKMGNALEKHEMTAAQLKQCAMHMEKLSTVMMDSANDVKQQKVETQQKQIKKLSEEWNYFESGNFEDH